MVHGEGRDGKVSQHDGNARLKWAEVAPLGQVAMDAVGAVLPALRAGIDRQRTGLVGRPLRSRHIDSQSSWAKWSKCGWVSKTSWTTWTPWVCSNSNSDGTTPMPQSISVCRTTWPSCRWTSEYETLACRYGLTARPSLARGLSRPNSKPKAAWMPLTRRRSSVMAPTPPGTSAVPRGTSPDRSCTARGCRQG